MSSGKQAVSEACHCASACRRRFLASPTTSPSSSIRVRMAGVRRTRSRPCHGLEALLKVKEHRPSAIFLDISMPHMDGTETLQLIREIDPKAQVVVVSGYASESLARDLLKQGACDFFQKPVDLRQLRETVERLRTLADLS